MTSGTSGDLLLATSGTKKMSDLLDRVTSETLERNLLVYGDVCGRKIPPLVGGAWIQNRLELLVVMVSLQE